MVPTMLRPPSVRAVLTMCSAAGALLVTTATQAAAAPTTETEPNDSIFQSSSPIDAAGAAGVLGTASDRDVFLVRLRPQRQVKITYEALSFCGSVHNTNFSLLTPSGDSIGAPEHKDDFQISPVIVDYSAKKSFTVTTPGTFGASVRDYYLTFWASSDGAVGCKYTFSVTGPQGEATDAIDSSPRATYPLVPVPEPNDLDGQAVGPLAADTFYTGQIETTNDRDVMYVPVKAGASPTFELESAVTETEGVIAVRGQTHGSSLEAPADRLHAVTMTPASKDVVYSVSLWGRTGALWRLRVSPPEALGTTVGPTDSGQTPGVLRRIRRQVSIARASGRYRGRVTASESTCTAGARVTLHRQGKSKTYGAATTRGDGSWTVKRSRIRGKVYAKVGVETREQLSCRADRSRTLRR